MLPLGVSGFPSLRVPFSKEPGTRLKNRFCALSHSLVFGYNLSSILEQVTTGSRVLENGERTRVPGNGELAGSRVPRNGQSALILSPRFFEARVPGNGNSQ